MSKDEIYTLFEAMGANIVRYEVQLSRLTDHSNTIVIVSDDGMPLKSCFQQAVNAGATTMPYKAFLTGAR